MGFCFFEQTIIIRADIFHHLAMGIMLDSGAAKLADLATRDLIGRKPHGFIRLLDELNWELTDHLNNPMLYPQCKEWRWNNEDNADLAYALKQWLTQIRPLSAIEVVHIGLRERGYKAISHHAAMVRHRKLTRFVDGAGVFEWPDYVRRMRELHDLRDVEIIAEPSKTKLIQSRADPRRAITFFRMLMGTFTPDAVQALRKRIGMTASDIKVPDRLYHVTRERVGKVATLEGLRASLCGENHEGRAYGSPTRGIYLTGNSTPGDRSIEVPPKFNPDEFVWITITIDGSKLDPARLRPDPEMHAQWKSHQTLCTAAKMREFLGMKDASEASALYDQMLASMRAGFSERYAAFWS